MSAQGENVGVLTGRVLSDKMEKSITVVIDRFDFHHRSIPAHHRVE